MGNSENNIKQFEDHLALLFKAKIDKGFSDWLNKNALFGNGRDKKRIQICCVNGKNIANIDHLKVG